MPQRSQALACAGDGYPVRYHRRTPSRPLNGALAAFADGDGVGTRRVHRSGRRSWRSLDAEAPLRITFTMEASQMVLASVVTPLVSLRDGLGTGMAALWNLSLQLGSAFIGALVDDRGEECVVRDWPE